MTKLEKLARDHAAAKERVAALRVQLDEAIVEESKAGMPQVEIVRQTGFTRETVRQIVNRSKDAKLK